MPTEQQHYVPRFLLKNFASGKKPKIWAFDKSNDSRFQTNIKNVAAERGFYDIRFEDDLFTYEPGLSKLESSASSAVSKIIASRNIGALSEKDFAVLAVFLAVQFVRTKEHRLRFRRLGELLAESMIERGLPADDVHEYFNPPEELPNEKIIGFEAIRNANKIVPYFLNKRWVLFETTRSNRFYISDNPVTMHNDIDHGPYGNIGLGVLGIQIFFPISSTLSIGIFCPSITEQFEATSASLKMLDGLAPGLADQTMKRPAEVRAFCRGLETGEAIEVSKDNVTMMNSLQVLHSSRFVYCEENEFDLVVRMIADDEARREALRPVVN